MRVVAISYAAVLALSLGLAVLFHFVGARTTGSEAAPVAAAPSDETGPSAEADVARIERQLVPRLRARYKGLRIGTPDCSRPTDSNVYYRICYLPLDGASAPIGLRYDDDVERIIPRLLWALVDAKAEERGAANLARFEYDTNATATCPGPRWRVMPPGHRFECSLKTDDGRQRTLGVAIGDGAFGPYPALDTIPGLRIDPQVGSVDASIASQLRAHHSIPGPLVIRYYELASLRFYNALVPQLHAGKMVCPRVLSPGDLNAFCSIESRFGYIRLGVEADDNDRLHFYPLSVPANLHAAARMGKSLIETAYHRKGVSIVAHVDCGQQTWVTISRPGVYYCSVTLSNGKLSRMGVEYYDEVEGIHLSFEPAASRTAPQ